MNTIGSVVVLLLIAVVGAGMMLGSIGARVNTPGTPSTPRLIAWGIFTALAALMTLIPLAVLAMAAARTVLA